MSAVRTYGASTLIWNTCSRPSGVSRFPPPGADAGVVGDRVEVAVVVCLGGEGASLGDRREIARHGAGRARKDVQRLGCTGLVAGVQDDRVPELDQLPGRLAADSVG